MIQLDGVKMNVTETAGNGVVNHETIFNFTQRRKRVMARYSGGKVTRGVLVGRLVNDLLEFNFVQEHLDGKIAGGMSKCDVVQSEQGITLIENFDWEKGKGRNVFKEIGGAALPK